MPVVDSHLKLLQENEALSGLPNPPDIFLPNYAGFGLANLTPASAAGLADQNFLPLFSRTPS